MASEVARRLAAIVFMDVVGFSRLMEKDEIGTFQRLLALQHDVVKPAAAAHNGRLVKAVGDGFLTQCPDAVDAFSFAVAVNRALVGHPISTTAR